MPATSLPRRPTAFGPRRTALEPLLSGAAHFGKSKADGAEISLARGEIVGEEREAGSGMLFFRWLAKLRARRFFFDGA